MIKMSENRIMPTPRQVDIAVTGRCNLSCSYCFYADEMVARRDLPTERWLTFFEELGELGVMTVCLTGGEAFTRPDFFDLIDGVIANRMRYQILSNGTLISEKILAQFETGKRRKRLDSIQVSIDGSRAEIHDQSRPHSFDRSIRGLRLLKEAGFPVTVRVTVNRYNINDLENIAHLLLDDIGLHQFTTNEAYACGATNRFETGIMLTHAQRQQATRILLTLSERYPGRVSANAGPLAFANEEKIIQEAMTAGQSSLPGRGNLCACGGVFNKMAVLHDGGVVPCHNLSTLLLGNILEDDFGQVWRNHPVMRTLRQRGEISLDTVSTCKDCTYRGFCSGGCPGGALFLTGKLNERNPMDCYRILVGEEEYINGKVEPDSPAL
jgi:SynChlorMet cassette radical SAM/SPASM protein ScmE